VLLSRGFSEADCYVREKSFSVDGSIVGTVNSRPGLAPSGAVRVEAVKVVNVNSMVQKYATAGWTVVDQTTQRASRPKPR
jgi:hypothetical protein